MNKFFERILPHYEMFLVKALRMSLGIIFVWFGALKLFGYNPVYEIVYASFPWFADGVGLVVLGVIEVAIGVGLLFHLMPQVVHAALLLHLLGTFTVFISGPSVMFQTFSPILTLAGEFVAKNTILAIAGLVVIGYRKA